ncbi:hypothetical protein D9758_014455 [Tetrapyrgos nigripes]|uniref:Uncharacterized protein n=1 Tax=Tetrapyrgos nigripes TaxID=182062 RepID=A0A8H5BVU8_9AGAR|nr:hypothetical protein D9758_014455 [Tetrapyrgos nigripes]
MPSIYAVAIFFLAALLNLVLSAPLAVRDVYAPPVLCPHNGTVWKVGHKHNVTWDISNPPAQITNRLGMIVLVKNGRLDIDHPLAKGFEITTGRFEIKVPDVKPGVYKLVLFGDSGNDSEEFRIEN